MSDARHVALAQKLKATTIPTVDLMPVLDGIPNTYRLNDQHWNEKGHEIVASRVLEEIGEEPYVGGENLANRPRNGNLKKR